MLSESSISITFKSDWRIGSGTGRPGDVDQLIRRDRTSVPFVPAKTIIGIWRDSCERVANALDSDQAEGATWRQWVDYLFGSQPNLNRQSPGDIPQPAHLSVKSAYLPEEIRQAIAAKPVLQSAITFVKPGVKIDNRSGTAEEQCFRIEEMARGEITLSANLALTILEEDEADALKTEKRLLAAQSLLAAGASLVERIGGKRRRGAGRCEMIFDGLPTTEAIAFLDKNASPPKIPQGSGTDKHRDLSVDNSTHWERVVLTLTTQQPVIISRRVVGNVIESLDYIPASHLLSIVARHLRGFRVDIGQAIARSQLVITHALPTNKSQQPTAPMPLCLYAPKSAITRKDNLLTCTNILATQLDDSQQYKQQRGGYITLGSDSTNLERVAVETGIETHNTVNDHKQRPTRDVGGVYSYQSIPPDTQLRAEIRIQKTLIDEISKEPHPADNRPWHVRLAGNYDIGISRKDEYGQVKLSATAPEPIRVDASDNASINTLTVWLLSDVLLRDRWLKPTTDIQTLINSLAVALGLGENSLELMESNQSDLLFARKRRTESWQTRWGLPRPSLGGLQAGCCFKFRIVGELPTTAAVAQLAITGIGERRVEGYGQLLLNSPLLEATNLSLYSSDSSESRINSHNVTGSGQPFDYVRQVEKVAWRKAISRAAATKASNQKFRKDELAMTVDNGNSYPSLSQLGGLREQITRLQFTDEQQSVEDWVTSMSEKKENKETFNKVLGLIRADGQQERHQNEHIWTLLNFPEALQLTYSDLCCTSTGEADLKRLLWAEAIEVLVSECIRAQTRETERQTTDKREVSVAAS